MLVAVQHRTNWQDGIQRWERREKFVWFLQDALGSLDIGYRTPTVTVQLVDKFEGMGSVDGRV